jgi:hypothetical protein
MLDILLNTTLSVTLVVALWGISEEWRGIKNYIDWGD